jgi:uncharacterized membrane protein
MTRGRLEAFSDGVLAIAITIMVLELKAPHGDGLEALQGLVPVFLAYVLSFLYVGIYWANHHHLMHTVTRVNGGILWANLHLLFWLSLFPAVTAWAGDHPRAAWPTALYGVVLLAAAVAWLVLQRAIARAGGTIQAAVGRDLKGKLSTALYLLGIAASFVRPWIAQALYAAVALIWIVPDRRIERRLGEGGE